MFHVIEFYDGYWNEVSKFSNEVEAEAEAEERTKELQRWSRFEFATVCTEKEYNFLLEEGRLPYYYEV